MRAVLTRAHEAQISTLREELEQEKLRTAEAHARIAKLTVELGDAAAALQTEKQKLEALRQSTDVLRAKQRAAWGQVRRRRRHCDRVRSGRGAPDDHRRERQPGPDR